MKLHFFFIGAIIISSSIYAQTDWQRWGKAENLYQLKTGLSSNTHSSEHSSFLHFARNLYGFLISDLDGDNCPFYPTCSSFFVEAVQQSNIVKGTLMFADRFTRDLNVLKIENNYPIAKNGRFNDPVLLYTNRKTDMHTALHKLND